MLPDPNLKVISDTYMIGSRFPLRCILFFRCAQPFAERDRTHEERCGEPNPKDFRFEHVPLLLNGTRRSYNHSEDSSTTTVHEQIPTSLEQLLCSRITGKVPGLYTDD